MTDGGHPGPDASRQMSPPEALVQAQLEAYNAQDIEAFVACYHPECEFVRWSGEVDLRGHAAFREAYTGLWRRSPRLRAHILQRMVVGRHVIDLELMLHHADGPRDPLVALYETEGACIRRVRVLTPAD